MLSSYVAERRSGRFLASAKRLVVKVGSSLLVETLRSESGAAWLASFVQDLAACRKSGQDVVLVSSGAVALGRQKMGLWDRKLRPQETKAAAACGQAFLIQTYQELFARHGCNIAQLLLTLSDTEARGAFLHTRDSLEQLLGWGLIPVINENDVVATPEGRYGDNDRLAARIATMIKADCLVLLSDIDGLFTADPSKDPQARLIEEIHGLTAEIMAMGQDAASPFGRGGMRTKLQAARIALAGGCGMIIAKGNRKHPLQAIKEGGLCSLFLPAATQKNPARKAWIYGGLAPAGCLIIDDGACAALSRGRSLLAVGVKEVQGRFDAGALVQILSQCGAVVGQGIAQHDSVTIQSMLGKQREEVAELLGDGHKEEIIHRDNLAVWQAEERGQA